MAWMNESSLYVLVVLSFIVLKVNAKQTCVTVRVRAEYFQQSFLDIRISSQSSFRSNYEQLSKSAKVKGSYVFSGSAQASYEHVTSSVNQTSKNEYTEKEDLLTFSSDFLQILRKITTRVTISGSTAYTVLQEYVDIVDKTVAKEVESQALHLLVDLKASYNVTTYTKVTKTKPKTSSELRKLETDYIRSYFGNDNGKISGHTYTETKCIEDEKSWKCKCLSPNNKSNNGITCAFSSDSRPAFGNSPYFYCAYWQKCRSHDIIDGAEVGLTNSGDRSNLESGRFMQRGLKCNPDYCYGHADPPSYSSWCL